MVWVMVVLVHSDGYETINLCDICFLCVVKRFLY